MRVELRQIDTDRLLAALEVDEIGDVPHPGRWLESAGRSFLVLQRRHRYQLRNGKYQLARRLLRIDQRPASPQTPTNLPGSQ